MVRRGWRARRLLTVARIGATAISAIEIVSISVSLGSTLGGIMTEELTAQSSAELGFSSSLAGRPAAYSVIREMVRMQERMRPQGILHRLFGFRPIHEDARQWFSGAKGELTVGKLLSLLGSEWTVLHAVPVGKGESDIDHVLVGPAGVFTINTKRHSGKKIWLDEHKLLVSGQKTDHLRNARYEAKRASRLLSSATGLSVDVHSIIVIVDSAGFTVRQRPHDVSVMDARHLLRWLKRRKPTLDLDTRRYIADAAADARTWHQSADLTVDPGLIDRFNALDWQDRQAYFARMAWAAAISIGAGLGSIWVLLPLIAA